jgi:VIT1/CCC1 family predicted Fe2+/Mn2+ transporter
MTTDYIGNLMKSKTFWTGVLTVAGAGAAYQQGALPAAEALQSVSTGLLAIFLKMAIAKIPGQNPPPEN